MVFDNLYLVKDEIRLDEFQTKENVQQNKPTTIHI